MPNAIHIGNGWIYTNQKNIANPRWESIDISGITKWKLVLDTALEFCETATKKCRFYVSNNNNPSTAVDLICENDNKTFIFDKKYDNIIYMEMKSMIFIILIKHNYLHYIIQQYKN